LGVTWPTATLFPGDTSSTGPSAAVSDGLSIFNRNVAAYRANDATGNIWIISQRPGMQFQSSTRIQPFCCTNWTPGIFRQIQGATFNSLLYLYWTEASSRRIRFSISPDDGRSWAQPAMFINGVETSKDQPWAASSNFGQQCLYFISNDATNIIRATCSLTGRPGDWLESLPIN
jgi:hypothetical protein